MAMPMALANVLTRLAVWAGRRFRAGLGRYPSVISLIHSTADPAPRRAPRRAVHPLAAMTGGGPVRPAR